MSFMDKLRGTMSGDEWTREEERFRARHRDAGEYERLRPAYAYGFSAGRDERFRDNDFSASETELQRGWSGDLASSAGDWSAVRSHVNEGFTRGRELRITRSEEELAIGKRTVSAGEVGLRKTVETEHVRESVPVTREEVTVERHPVNEVRAAGAADLREENIRVPLHAEEVVVEKRPVVKEEIVIRKHAVNETENVEADLRRERVDIDDTTRTSRTSRDAQSDDLRR